MIKRELFKEIQKWFGEDKILIIKGARQTGKTTLIWQIKDFLEKKGDKTAYFSIDQELTNPIFSDAKLFLRYLNDQFSVEKIDSGRKLFVFLDEFQYLPRANLFLKNIFDSRKEKIQLIVSGSSSLEITRESEFLTGRKIDFYLNRFSFREFLLAASETKYDFKWNLNDGIKDLRDFYRVYAADLKANFLTYLSFGGYPEVVTTSDFSKKETILKEIISTYIQKDVSGFLKVENITGFNNLVALLCQQIGNLVNKAELGNTLGLNARSISRYLEILEGTYIFSFLPPFFTNLRKTLTKRPKVFLEDLGILKIISGRAPYLSYDGLEGKVVENFVFNELARKIGKENIFYFRTLSGVEIDFILRQADRVIPTEVKFQKKISKLPKNLRDFGEENKAKLNFYLTVTKDDLRKDRNKEFYLPAVLLPFVEF